MSTGEMSTEQFCLRWNDFHKTITSTFSDLRDDDEFLDVTLVSKKCVGRSSTRKANRKQSENEIETSFSSQAKHKWDKHKKHDESAFMYFYVHTTVDIKTT